MPHRNYIYIGIRNFTLTHGTFCGHGETGSKAYSTILQTITLTVGNASSCNNEDKFNYLCGVAGNATNPLSLAGPRPGWIIAIFLFFNSLHTS